MKCIELLFSGGGRFHGRDWWVKWLTLPKCIPTFCFFLRISNYFCFLGWIVFCVQAPECVSVCAVEQKCMWGVALGHIIMVAESEWVLHRIASPTLELISSLPHNEWSKLGRRQRANHCSVEYYAKKKSPIWGSWQNVVLECYFRLFVMQTAQKRCVFFSLFVFFFLVKHAKHQPLSEEGLHCNLKRCL